MSQPSPARPRNAVTIRLQSTPEAPYVVPQPRLPLIGRDTEVETVRALIADARAPLVTLTGPGGSGKTRLSLAVTALLQERFPDGIWFVDLSALRNSDLVPAAILQELGLRESGTVTIPNRLEQYLRPRTALLVLDNFEQVVEAATGVSTLLTACPNLQVIVTSRTPLHLTMEHLVRVPPLDLPQAMPDMTRPEFETAPAVLLFRQAARRVVATFDINASNADVVASICERIDGLPLAIELAAAQIALYSPESLLARLDHRLATLGQGPRDAPVRLRSLRDTIEWSYDLLDAHLQRRFRRLCVFDGGFTAETAAQVTSDVPLTRWNVDEHIASLVDANLIVAHPQIGRFTMLETIREFGLGELDRSGEHDAVRSAHAHWCVDLLEQAYPEWYSPTQTAWGALLDDEHFNLRAALSWWSSRPNESRLVELVGLMWPFWFVRGHWDEGLDWLQRVTPGHPNRTSLQHLRLLAGLTCLWMMKGDVQAASSYCEQALALSEQVEGVTSTDQPYNPMALCANARGDQAEGTRWNAFALNWLRQRVDSEPNALPMISVILNNVGWNEFVQGNLDEAERITNEAWAIQQEIGFDWAAANALFTLANIAEARGLHADATGFHRQSLQFAVQSHDQSLVADILLRFAGYADSTGYPEQARALRGTGLRIKEMLGEGSTDSDGQPFSSVESGITDTMRWWRAGYSMNVEQALEMAFQVTVPPPQQDLLARYGLTGREREVLLLVSHGLTDREIAALLSISLRTVNAHVANILAKMQVTSRRYAADLIR